MPMMKRTAAAVVAWMLASSAVWAAEAWNVIHKERGITVSTREEPGRQLPSFRGQGVLKMPILHALAVVLDAEGAVEWAKGADEVHVLRAYDARTHVIYNRTHSPWPVSDRELVVKRVIKVVDPGREFHVEMNCISGERPPTKHVIRVAQCYSRFLLKRVDDTHTYADYEVNVDPAGSLPNWLVRWASKRIPFETLVALEERVRDKRAQYAAAAQSWASAQ
jgi:hypothetical protein